MSLSVDKALRKAQSHLKNGELAEAESLYKQVLSKFPKNKKAIQGYHKLKAGITSKDSLSSEPPQEQIDELIRFYNLGRFEEVLLKAKPLSKFFPKASILLNLLGSSNMALLNYNEALENYNSALKMEPKNADFLHNMGNALSGIGDIMGAIGFYEKAQKKMPDDPEVLYKIGLNLQKIGALNESLNSYKQAVKIKPDYAEAFMNMGNILGEKGELNSAIDSYKQALKIKPDYVEAYSNLGLALKDKGDLEGAIDSYKQALKIKPDYAEAYNNMGIALKGTGDLTAAIDSYKQAIQIKPNYAEVYSNMGNALTDKGDLDAAIDSYKQAINIRPDYAEVYNNLGLAFKEKGELDAAKKCFETVLKKDPEDALGARMRLASLTQKGIPSKTPIHYMNKFYKSKSRSWGNDSQYRGHLMIKNAVENSFKERVKIDILDLGCGTGTLADFLMPYTRTLCGVDLSPDMLKEAAQTGLYDFLHEKDIEIYLKETPDQYDMVIAAAVMIHFFDLEHVFSLIIDKLRPNGKLIFSVFEAPEEEIELNSFLMYSHSDKYITSLAERLNCKVCYRKKDIHEYHPEPINGLAYVFERYK